jgi:hypothetical protein
MPTHPDDIETVRSIAQKLLTGRAIAGKLVTTRTTSGWDELSISAEPLVRPSGAFFSGYSLIIERAYSPLRSAMDGSLSNFISSSSQFLRSYLDGDSAHAAAFSITGLGCQGDAITETRRVVEAFFKSRSAVAVSDDAVLCVLADYSHPENLPAACENLCAALMRTVPSGSWAVGAATTRTAGASLVDLIEQSRLSAAAAHQSGCQFTIYEASEPMIASPGFPAAAWK